MGFRVGQKVAYPNHGVCKIENIAEKGLGEQLVRFYSLRVLANNSVIHVPVENAESVGIRPIINAMQCQQLLEFLTKDFEDPQEDWKVRTREFGLRFQTGDLFETADILKKLTFIARAKKLSFREQRMFEKAKFLVVSELAVVCSQAECQIEAKVEELLGCACENHSLEKIELASSATH